MPDTFFRNEKIGAFHNILTPNLYIRIFPDGDVLFSIRCRYYSLRLEKDLNILSYHILVYHSISYHILRYPTLSYLTISIFYRISITCACSMHLALFPLDEQTCSLDVASCKFHCSSCWSSRCCWWCWRWLWWPPQRWSCIIFGLDLEQMQNRAQLGLTWFSAT